MSTFEYIIVESKGAVGIVTLNRPKLLNALSSAYSARSRRRSTISKPTTRSAASF